MKLHILHLLLFIPIVAFSQSMDGIKKPNFINPSPKSASLGVYGDINVALSSGSMATSVPLYALKEQSLTLNVSLDYLFSGYRPSGHGTSVGIGWSLNAGGVITRTVNGLLDEDTEGFINRGNDYSLSPLTNQQNIDISYGIRDAQPDMFSFNFMGYSGKFYFGNDGQIHFVKQEPFKIRYESINPVTGYVLIPNRTIGRFIITDNQGVTYIFNSVEVSRSYAVGVSSGDKHLDNVITSWYLSKVIGVNGEMLEFNYTIEPPARFNVTESASQKNVIGVVGGGAGSGTTFPNPGIIYIRNKTFEIYLSSIKGSLWQLDFQYSDKSFMLGVGNTTYFKSLDAVILKDAITTQEHKRFELLYSNETYRHLLKSVKEKSTTSESKPYLFEYFHETRTYPINPMSIDKWGYYNGKFNLTLDEKNSNRKPEFEYAKTFALKKITYPTGGISTTDYLWNDYSYNQGDPYTLIEETGRYYAFVWELINDVWQVTYSDTIRLENGSAPYRRSLVDVENPIDDNLHNCLIKSGTLNNGVYTATSNPIHLGAACLNQLRNAGNTYLGIIVYTKENVKYGHGAAPGYNSIIAGGLRVHQIQHYDAESGTETINYEYGSPGLPGYSSGNILNTSPTRMDITFTGSYWPSSAVLIRSEPFNSMSLSPVLYEYVTEKRNNLNYKRYRFSAFGDSGGIDAYGEQVPTFFNTIEDFIVPQSFGPSDNFDFLRGKPIKITHLNTSAGTYYSAKARVETQKFKSQSDLVSSPAYYKTYAYFSEFLFTSPENNHPVNILKKYTVSSVWPRIEMTIDSTFNHLGQFMARTTVDYSYDNPLHKQLTQQKTSLSDGSFRKVLFRYPQDYSGGIHAVYQTMKDSNMIGIPLETLYYRTVAGQPDKLYDAAIFTFKSVAGNTRKSNLIVPYKTFSLASASGTPGIYNAVSNSASPSGYRELLDYLYYNTNGNPEEVKWLGSKNIAFLWGYKGQHVVAQAENATRSNVTTALSSTGQSLSSILSLTNESALRTHLNSFVQQASLSSAAVTLQTFHPIYGVASLISPDKTTQYFDYDKLGRLSTARNISGEITGHWRYRYHQPSGTKNHIINYMPKVGSADTLTLDGAAKALVRFNYFSGLGNAMQTVGKAESPTGKDVVSGAVQYDNRRRPFKQFLAAPASESTGVFQSDPGALASSFYADTRPFSEVISYDNSSLGRELSKYNPGSSWLSNTKLVFNYPSTTGTEVRLYSTSSAGNLTYGNYASSRLLKTHTINEQGNSITQITNTEGKLVESHQGSSITAYVYDDAGKLKAVIQPEGYALNAGILYNSDHFSKYVFFYEYDGNNRLIRKHTPGAGWTELVYDKADRLVMLQDAYQKTLNRWSFKKYDALDREMASGETTKTQTRAAAQSLFDTHTSINESRSGANYTDVSFPTAIKPLATEIEKYLFYDDYLFAPMAFNFNATGAFHERKSSAKGLLTGVRKWNSRDNSKYYTDVFYYDNLNRVIQSQHTHQKSSNNIGNIIVKNIKYNFEGSVAGESTNYPFASGTLTLKEASEFDLAGRIISSKLGINTEPNELIKYSYDEIGRLKQKKYFGNGVFGVATPEFINRPPSPTTSTEDIATGAVILSPGTDIKAGTGGVDYYLGAIDELGTELATSLLQTVDYAWHIRGGLQGINLNSSKNPMPNTTEKDLFSYKLEYETAGQWAGNIGKQSWTMLQALQP